MSLTSREKLEAQLTVLSEEAGIARPRECGAVIAATIVDMVHEQIMEALEEERNHHIASPEPSASDPWEITDADLDSRVRIDLPLPAPKRERVARKVAERLRDRLRERVERSQPSAVDDPESEYMNLRTCTCGRDAHDHGVPGECDHFDPHWPAVKRRMYELADGPPQPSAVEVSHEDFDRAIRLSHGAKTFRQFAVRLLDHLGIQITPAPESE